MRIKGISKSKAGFFVRLAFWFSQRRFGKVAGENREFEVADFPRLGKRMVKSGENFDVYDMSNAKPFGPLDR